MFILHRYVDLSKNTKRKDNPIFFRPLGPHEKLPKHLREGKALHAAGDGNYLSLVTNSSKGTTDNAICNTMKSKGMPYKRRYSEDGKKDMQMRFFDTQKYVASVSLPP